MPRLKVWQGASGDIIHTEFFGIAHWNRTMQRFFGGISRRGQRLFRHYHFINCECCWCQRSQRFGHSHLCGLCLDSVALFAHIAVLSFQDSRSFSQIEKQSWNSSQCDRVRCSWAPVVAMIFDVDVDLDGCGCWLLLLRSTYRTQYSYYLERRDVPKRGRGGGRNRSDGQASQRYFSRKATYGRPSYELICLEALLI